MEKKIFIFIPTLLTYSLILVYFFGLTSLLVWNTPHPTPLLYTALLDLAKFLVYMSYFFLGIIFGRMTKYDFKEKAVVAVIASAIHYPGFISIINMTGRLDIFINEAYLFPIAVSSITVYGFPLGVLLISFISKRR